MISYWHSISKIEAQKYLGYDLDLSRSRDVIGHVTVRLTMAHFL